MSLRKQTSFLGPTWPKCHSSFVWGLKNRPLAAKFANKNIIFKPGSSRLIAVGVIGVELASNAAKSLELKNSASMSIFQIVDQLTCEQENLYN